MSAMPPTGSASVPLTTTSANSPPTLPGCVSSLPGSSGAAYVRQTEEAYAEEVRQREKKRLQRQARSLGYELKKIEPSAAPPG